jgi:serine/threonine protein kinase
LVDYLNSRLENRPQEQEILFIFSQICSAVAHMHSFSPSIVHRDIKIENVLLNNGKFKLCDFGSCTTDSSPANTFLSIQEIRKLEDEISSKI